MPETKTVCTMCGGSGSYVDLHNHQTGGTIPEEDAITVKCSHCP